MNLQRLFNKAVFRSFGLSLIIVFLVYYFAVNRSLERELKKELVNAANLHALSIDFTLRTYETDMKALGSRTMIRKELYRYTQGNITLEEIIAFTDPKYKDGAAVIEDVIGVRRVLTDGTPISFFGDQKNLINRDLTNPGISLINDTVRYVLIVEPIMEAGDTIGYDAGCFDTGFLFQQKPNHIKQFKLVPLGKPAPKVQESGVVAVTLPKHSFMLVAEGDPDLLFERKARLLIPVVANSLLILVVIALIFYFTQFRLVKKIIRRLRDSEVLLNSTQKLAKAGGWEYNAESKETQWTKGTFLIFEIPEPKSSFAKKEMIQEALLCFDKNDREDLLDSLENCIKDEKITDREYPVTTVRGNTKFLRIVLYPNNVNGSVSKVTGTIIDITDQKEAEKEHWERMELEKKVVLAEESLRFKQNFLSNMSHEMRTPLNGILGMTEILEMTDLTADQQDYVKTLSQSGEDLKNLVNKILDFSKIEAGNIQLNKERFSFSKFMNKLEDSFYRICHKPIELKVKIDNDVPEWLIADETRIFEIADQLMTNAIKFTEQGQIIVKADVVHRSVENDEVMMKISVSDTGIGIKEDVKEGIIDPFCNLHETDIRNFDGAGLGLAMSQRLAALHGGEMGFQGKPGKGTIVWFTFAATAAEGRMHYQKG